MRKVIFILFISALASAFTAQIGVAGEQYVSEWPTFWDDQYLDTASTCVDTTILQTFPATVDPGSSIWVYASNLYLSESSVKYADFELYGTGLYNSLSYNEGKGFHDTISVTTTYRSSTQLQSPDGIRIRIDFAPQPDCEMIKITNNGTSTITIDSAKVVTHCRVPSLTSWGLAVLLLLLILSGAYVIYHKRKGLISV